MFLETAPLDAQSRIVAEGEFPRSKTISGDLADCGHGGVGTLPLKLPFCRRADLARIRSPVGGAALLQSILADPATPLSTTGCQ